MNLHVGGRIEEKNLAWRDSLELKVIEKGSILWRK